MPRLDDSMAVHKIGGGFAYTGTRIERLGATDYTLATIAVDVTGSVRGFEQDLRKALQMAVEGCQKSPRSDNLLVRVLYFSTKFGKGVLEVHGFKPLADIDTSAYPDLEPSGFTPLCDAAYSAIGATLAYGEQLADQDFGVNGIIFIITDGGDNASVATMAMIQAEQEKVRKSEKLESLISILIGVNTAQYQQILEQFRDEAGMTGYREVADATPRNLAKLAGFVSTSVSSQAQAQGTGGPSQQIAPTI